MRVWSGIYLRAEKYIIYSVYSMCIVLTTHKTLIYTKGDESQLKQRDLIKKLKKIGFRYERHGGNHDIYVRGKDIEMIPRHKEINEKLANAILKKWGIQYEESISSYFYTS